MRSKDCLSGSWRSKRRSRSTRRTIADPDLYARDRAAFDKASAALASAQADLAEAEDEWLRLEGLRDQVEAR